MIKLSDVWTEEEILSRKAFGATEIICPICKNETLDSWTICPHCGWEYDHTESGYSAANRSHRWWYKLKYKLKKLFSNNRC